MPHSIPNHFSKVLAFFFHHLYHTFAWAYDAVAWIVSAGDWSKWVQTVENRICDERVLEIGFGTGHLLSALIAHGKTPVGLDESMPMHRITARKVIKEAGKKPLLVRGLGQALPLKGDSIDHVVSTFPAAYIFANETVAGIARILPPGGQLTILLAVIPVGENWLHRVLRWLFQITGQSPSPQTNFDNIISIYQTNGIVAEAGWHPCKNGKLLILSGIKTKSH